jgi:hypothetical protein
MYTDYTKTMKHALKPIFLLLLFIVICALLFIYVFKKPSNVRDWEFGMGVLPHITIFGDSSIAVNNIRDNEYTGGTEFKEHYFNRKYSVSAISNIWFVVSKFSGFGGIAHTYFIFDMKDTDPITVSVEARREKGEKYSITGGLFNNFELIYIWATERDSVIRRSLISKDRVYMYPLVLSDESKVNLFLQLARRTQSLEYVPRFYNTLANNCTNELAKTANEIKPGTIPWNISLYLPGYSAAELHRLGYIAGDGPIDDIEKNHYITDFVSAHYADPNLTEEIRKFLSR